jgi:hypothetical protein
MSAFLRRPKAAAAIGRLITGYGDIELVLAYCLGAVMASRRKPLPSHANPAFHRMRYERIALKEIMKTRGAEERFKRAKKYMAPSFAKAGLDKEFNHVMGALTHCRKVRNLLAHCAWTGSKKRGLFFANLEESARQKGRLLVIFRHASTKTLYEQIDHFWHTRVWLDYLHQAYCSKNGLMRFHYAREPRKIPLWKTPNLLFPHKSP